MTIYNTNVSRHYAVSAGFSTIWSGVREIIQNALDGHDKGYSMSVDFGKARDRSGANALKVSNSGISLTKSALVLGFSTKTSDPTQRGKHGEGLVVGINALLNLGLEVWIRTGNEVWVPKHVLNEEGLEVLVIEIKKQQSISNDFIVEVKGLEQNDWDDIREKILAFHEQVKSIPTSVGRILLDEKYKNKLFVKGIYVGQMPDKSHWGYDLDIHINRDREVASTYELRDKVREAIIDAVNKNLFSMQDILDLLSDEEAGESRAFAEAYFWGESGGFHDRITNAFISQHGENAIPVSSIGEAQQAEHHGFKGVIVSKAIKKIVEHKVGTLEKRLGERGLKPIKRYTWAELTEEEKKNLTQVVDLVASVESGVSLNNVNIVDFVGNGVSGTAAVVSNGSERTVVNINIAKKLIVNKVDLLDTFVHEVAHKYAQDGDMIHEIHQRKIMASIIANKLMV